MNDEQRPGRSALPRRRFPRSRKSTGRTRARPRSTSRCIGRSCRAPDRPVRAPHPAFRAPHRPIHLSDGPLDESHRDVDAPDRHVVPAHAHERGSHADVGDPDVPVAHQLRIHDFPVLREAEGIGCRRQRARAAHFRHGARLARHRHAGVRHCLSRAVHDRASPRAFEHDRRKADPRRKQVSRFTDADRRSCPAGDRHRGDRLPDWTESIWRR